MEKKYMTVKEVAEMLRGSEVWVRKMVQSREIPSHRIAGKRLFETKEIEKWIEENEKKWARKA